MVEPTLITEETTTTRRIKATPDDLGKIFSEMDDQWQLETLKAMVKHMERWPKQWDAISIKLSSNSEFRHELRTLLGF